MRFLHCSDVHITQDYSHLTPWQLGPRRTVAMFEYRVMGRSVKFAHASQTLKQIIADAQRADHLVLSGDLTAYATDLEFAEVKAILEPALARERFATLIPGNHDVYTRGAIKEHRFEKFFGNLLYSDMPEYRAEDSFPFVHLLGEKDAVIGLLSARLAPLPGLPFGVIGKAQLAALARILKDPRLDGRAVLVTVHHAPLGEDGGPDKLNHGLVDREELLAMLPGPRFAVLHGHIHHRYWHPATERRPHLFCAGSSTQAGREGYWVIQTRDGRVEGGTQYVPGGSSAV